MYKKMTHVKFIIILAGLLCSMGLLAQSPLNEIIEVNSSGEGQIEKQIIADPTLESQLYLQELAEQEIKENYHLMTFPSDIDTLLIKFDQHQTKQNYQFLNENQQKDLAHKRDIIVINNIHLRNENAYKFLMDDAYIGTLSLGSFVQKHLQNQSSNQIKIAHDILFKMSILDMDQPIVMAEYFISNSSDPFIDLVTGMKAIIQLRSGRKLFVTIGDVDSTEIAYSGEIFNTLWVDREIEPLDSVFTVIDKKHEIKDDMYYTNLLSLNYTLPLDCHPTFNDSLILIGHPDFQKYVELSDCQAGEYHHMQIMAMSLIF